MAATLRLALLPPQAAVVAAQTADHSQMRLLLALTAALVVAVQTVRMLVLEILQIPRRLKETTVVLAATRQTLVEQAVAVLPQRVQTVQILTAATVVTARLRLFLAAA
jgi:hypothetical protein